MIFHWFSCELMNCWNWSMRYRSTTFMSHIHILYLIWKELILMMLFLQCHTRRAPTCWCIWSRNWVEQVNNAVVALPTSGHSVCASARVTRVFGALRTLRFCVVCWRFCYFGTCALSWVPLRDCSGTFIGCLSDTVVVVFGRFFFVSMRIGCRYRGWTLDHVYVWAAASLKHVLPWAHPSPQPKREISGSAIFAQLTADSPYTLHWAPLSLKIAPSHGGSGPHLIMVPLAHPSPQPKWHLDCFICFSRAH